MNYCKNHTVEMCKQLCLQSCYCKGFLIRYLDGKVPDCYFKNLLVNGHYSPQFPGDFYLKVPKTHQFSDEQVVSEFGLDCTGEVLMMLGRTYQKSGENSTLKFMLWFSCGLGGVEILCVLIVCCFLIKTSKDSNEATKGYQVVATRFKRFSYSELKQATGNFNEEIGRGAGGIVYKGKLSDNRVAAIKQLNVADQGEAEFLAEVSTTGKLNHMNLIDMWGYCAEGKNKLLVYAYMEHGSLAENFSSSALDWQRRFDIDLGTARGLAYRHEECLEWILHCDIKPQNILLDSNYQPKVSDFGLSKLLKRGEVNNSNFSKIRGTRGYMAPEWVLNQPITSKVDVYSYGIVILELMTGRSSATGIPDKHGNGEAEHTRLVTWARGKKNGAKDGEAAAWIEELVDPMLKGEYDQEKMGILLSLALQCVEEDKDARPSMNKVVETLMRDEHDH